MHMSASPSDLPRRGRPRSRNRATVGDLARPVPPVSPDTRSEQAAESFAADPGLFALAVVDAEGRPIGLLNRFKFLERLSGRFGRALTVTRSVSQFMERSPLVFDAAIPIDRVDRLFVEDDHRYVFDGFIVTRGGRYAGIGTGIDLMRALTDRRHSELVRQARHDGLTGLPNRHEFDQRLRDALDQASAARSRAALLFIDMDRFKHVNDTFGHSVGDLVLCAMARRFRVNVRRRDTVARLSGDEFAVVLHEMVEEGTAELVAANLREACSAPLQVDGHEVVVSCSIGVAVYPDDASSAESLVQAADAAVLYAKQVRNTQQRYGPEMTGALTGGRVSLSALRQAIAQQQLSVHYQPQIDLDRNRISGVEALVRWTHPIHGTMSTEDLVRVAEDSGLIGPISEFVLRTAMRDVGRWAADGLAPGLRLAVNISSVQLRQDVLVPMLDRLIETTGFAPTDLELEITETATMHAGRTAASTLHALKQRGFTMAIDDFGTGYSSLSRLERLPVDVLKIDRSFVGGIGEGGRQGAIAKAIIALGHSLGLQLVAEGIETADQLAFLRQEGCDIGQGFLLGRPMPADDLSALLRARGLGLAPSGRMAAAG
jgi:diguanylate cyclase (GGDEF)-like protein